MGIHVVNWATRFGALEPIPLNVRAWPDRWFIPSEMRIYVSSGLLNLDEVIVPLKGPVSVFVNVKEARDHGG
jgi:hypothetical protein